MFYFSGFWFLQNVIYTQASTRPPLQNVYVRNVNCKR